MSDSALGQAPLAGGFSGETFVAEAGGENAVTDRAHDPLRAVAVTGDLHATAPD